MDQGINSMVDSTTTNISDDGGTDGEDHDNNKYCPVGYENFWKELEPFVLNFNLCICILGIVLNIFSFLVFTRRPMVGSSTNALLAGICVADIIVMAAFIPQYVGQSQYMRFNHAYSTAIIWVIHEYFTSVFHPVSTWLTCSLAIWRYIVVVHPFQNKFKLTIRHVKLITAAIILLSAGMCFYSYLPNSIDIVEADENASWKEGGCGAKYCSYWTSYSLSRKIELWYIGFVSKVVPGGILTFVNIQLIRALQRSKEVRKKMRRMGSIMDHNHYAVNRASISVIVATAQDPNNNNSNGGIREEKRKPRIDSSNGGSGGGGGEDGGGSSNVDEEFERITRMLIRILFLFLVTEVPPGTLYVFETFFGSDFYFECRRPVHYFILTMIFLTGVLNPVVYVVMSRNFRTNLLQLLRKSKNCLITNHCAKCIEQKF